jgi:hypothetical protein
MHIHTYTYVQTYIYIYIYEYTYFMSVTANTWPNNRNSNNCPKEGQQDSRVPKVTISITHKSYIF